MIERRRVKTPICGLVCLAVVLLPGMVFGQGMDELIAKLDAISNDCPNAWVNEFHYDDEGIDTNEFVEVAFETGSGVSNLNEYQCWIYDQYGGAAVSIPLDDFTLGGSSNGFTFYTYMMPLDNYGTGIGISIDIPIDIPIFISYEGIVEATNGPYEGYLSEDVGVYESDYTPEGSSIALHEGARRGHEGVTKGSRLNI